MIDPQARNKLQQAQTARALSEGVEKIVGALQKSAVVPQKTPANDLADELRNLQRLMGAGNLTESLIKVSKSLDNFDIDQNVLAQLKALVADLAVKLKILAQIEAKLPKEIELHFPKQVPLPIQDIITYLEEIADKIGQIKLEVPPFP